MASKVYSIKYTNADIPFARPVVTITANHFRSIQVPFLTEGYVTRLIVKQASGVAVGFTVDLLDSAFPYPPGLIADGTNAADEIELYRILGQQTATSGNAVVFDDKEYGYPFHNQDGTYTNNQRYVYLILKPTSSGTTTTWKIALTGHNEVG